MMPLNSLGTVRYVLSIGTRDGLQSWVFCNPDAPMAKLRKQFGSLIDPSMDDEQVFDKLMEYGVLARITRRHFRSHELSDEHNEIRLGTAWYDRQSKRMYFVPAEHFGGILPREEGYRVFSEYDAAAIGAEIQACAQLLPENTRAVELANQAYCTIMEKTGGDLDHAQVAWEDAGTEALVVMLERTKEKAGNGNGNRSVRESP